MPEEGERKVSHGEKLGGYICFMLMLLFWSDLVYRLPGKLHLCHVIWCIQTP